MHTLLYLSTYLFLAALGLRCYTQALSSCGEWGLLPSCGAVACLVAESRLQGQGLQRQQHIRSAVVTCWLEGTWASVVMVHGLSCSTAYGNLPGPGIKPLVPCVVRQILIHYATREVPHFLL